MINVGNQPNSDSKVLICSSFLSTEGTAEEINEDYLIYGVQWNTDNTFFPYKYIFHLRL